MVVLNSVETSCLMNGWIHDYRLRDILRSDKMAVILEFDESVFLKKRDLISCNG